MVTVFAFMFFYFTEINIRRLEKYQHVANHRLITLVCALCQVFPKKLVYFSTWIDHTRWARNSWAIAAVVILTMADITDMVRLCLLILTASVVA